MSESNYIGFWNDYITFPSTVQQFEWLSSVPIISGSKDLDSILSRTRDGLMINIDLVVQYTLVKQQIGQIYLKFKDQYEQFFMSVFRANFQVACTDFNAADFWFNKTGVKDAFLSTCKKHAATTLMGMVHCWDVQVLSLRVPTELEHMIEARQVEQQRQAEWQERQKAEVVRAHTKVSTASIERDIAIVRAGAVADAYEIKGAAAADADFNIESAWAGILSQMLTEVQHRNITMSNTELNKFLQFGSFLEAKTSPLWYGDFLDGARVITGFDPGISGRVNRYEDL